MATLEWRRILVSALLLAAVAEFAVRGPIRLAQNEMEWNDFLSPYIQAKIWMLGKNPYSSQELVNLWPSDVTRPLFVDRDAASGVLAKRRGIPTPYPLTTFLLLSPFAELPWASALWLWLFLNVAAVVASLLALLSICGATWRDLSGRAFLAAAFALAPIHTGLTIGNPSMLAVGLMVGAVWAAHAHRDNTGGILLALAVCLKPQLGLCLLFYYFIRRCRRLVSVGAIAIALVSIAAVLRLTWAGVAWLPAYRECVGAIFGPGAIGDFAQSSLSKFTTLNLQVLFCSFCSSRLCANVLALGCCGILAAIWLWLCLSHRQNQLLEISALFVISLLPVYHRFYDATLLIWPLCWGMLIATKRSVAPVTMVLIMPFLIPGPAFLAQLAQSGRIAESLVERWWWNVLIMPHQVWCLLFLSLWLLYLMNADPSRGREAVISRKSSQVSDGSTS
jgi:Glycosyltransferase family 87